MARQAKDRDALTVLLSPPLARALQGNAALRERFGIEVLHRPMKAAAIYRRYGLFPYTLALSEEGRARLHAACDPDPAEALLTEEDVLSYRLSYAVDAKKSWVWLTMLLSYRAERSRRDRKRAGALVSRVREIKERHRGVSEMQMRDALGKTVH